MKILIVEDETLLAIDLTNEVTKLGHSVCGTARDEHAAVAMGTDHKPDVVLMDLRLANGTCGARAAEKLYELHHIRCIFVSGNLDPARRNALAAVKPFGFVNKPVHPHNLRVALSAASSLLDWIPRKNYSNDIVDDFKSQLIEAYERVVEQGLPPVNALALVLTWAAEETRRLVPCGSVPSPAR